MLHCDWVFIAHVWHAIIGATFQVAFFSLARVLTLFNELNFVHLTLMYANRISEEEWEWEWNLERAQEKKKEKKQKKKTTKKRWNRTIVSIYYSETVSVSTRE